MGEATLMIGQMDSLPGQMLHQVRTALRLEDGRVVVADGGSNEVRTFDSAGRLLTTFGGSGGGPREFEALMAMWLAPDDSLVTWDGLSRRVVVWSSEGDLGRMLDLDLDGLDNVVGRLEDGSLVGIGGPPFSPMAPGTSRLDSATAFLLVPGGKALRALDRFPWSIFHAVPHPGLGEQTIYTPTAFDPGGIIASGPDYFYFGWGDAWEIVKYSASGMPIDTLTREGEPARVTPDMLEDHLEEWLTIVPPELHPATRTFHSRLPFPETAPVFDWMILDDLKHLWVRHFVAPGADSATWSIFGPNGDWLGELVLPANLRPTHIGADFIVAIVLGTDDVEQVGTFPLRRRTADRSDSSRGPTEKRAFQG